MSDLIYNLHAKNIIINYHRGIDAHSVAANKCSVVPDNPKKIDERVSGLEQHASHCDHDCVCDPVLEFNNQRGAPYMVFGKNWAAGQKISQKCPKRDG